ncbi:signal transduction histidine kinase [Allocatelliglobosispora scoriae]|uniref:histidine kinase n=1 Tax=Allocatelliglobosispora scoriae TaxID=643052 RepID=A0A841BKB0_9ACTN|nr:nitrate- and nitrite sensing domain-containing protein [Allocatelliglobosispora scoriae]MBB5869537.1 signal transduction histidine kinase [Allocatelliglobosispora scoriae]
MKSRTSNLRVKIAFLLVSLTALWAFAAFVTLREGLNLIWISSLDQQVGRPTDSLVSLLQDERRLSAVALAGPADAPRDALTSARAKTNAAADVFRTSALGSSAQFAATGLARQRIDELKAKLDLLETKRSEIDARLITRTGAVKYYTDTIGIGYQIYETIATFDDRDINTRLGHLLTMSRGREVLSQEDALMSGVLADGNFRTHEAAEFGQLVGAQRYIRTLGLAGLPDDAAIFDPVLKGPELTKLQEVEDRLILGYRDDATMPVVSAAEWRAAVDPARVALIQLDNDLADAAVERASWPAILVVVRLVLAAGLGLIAVIASVIVSVTTARALVSQLRRLRDAADELATVRLPRVVERLRAGEEVDVAVEAPPLIFGDDEIGQVGQAFNAAQETAVRTAVEQAELRRSVRDVFVSLARRSQTLLHRQLTLLDGMERRASDPGELDELFRVDHLATRMRRNAENLIVLSGAAPGRGWRRTVPAVDVIRAAIAEVEEYTRVTLLPTDPAGLAGRAVGDVIHLLAELIENAISFSPPHTTVDVRGSEVGTGYTVEIIDRGLGMSDADLDEANEQLRHPPEFKLSSTARLGLFVVGRLAERHHIEVQLRRSPSGGTAVIVLIPGELITETPALPAPAALAIAAAPLVAPPQRPDGERELAPSGLPLRTRKNSRSVPTQAEPSEVVGGPAAEQARKLMASYQLGSRRARFEIPEDMDATPENDG